MLDKGPISVCVFIIHSIPGSSPRAITSWRVNLCPLGVDLRAHCQEFEMLDPLPYAPIASLTMYILLITYVSECVDGWLLPY